MPKTPGKAAKKRGSPSPRGGKRKPGPKAKKKNISMPKLPLYSSSSKAKANLAWSKDDILKQVKAIEDADKVPSKKLEFSAGDIPTTNFLPCSSFGYSSGSFSASNEGIKAKAVPTSSNKTAASSDQQCTSSALCSEICHVEQGQVVGIKQPMAHGHCSQLDAVPPTSFCDVSEFYEGHTAVNSSPDLLKEIRAWKPIESHVSSTNAQVKNVGNTLVTYDYRRSPTFNVFASSFDYYQSPVRRRSDPEAEKCLPSSLLKLDPESKYDNKDSHTPRTARHSGFTRSVDTDARSIAAISCNIPDEVNLVGQMNDTFEGPDDLPCSISAETLNSLIRRPNSFHVSTPEKNKPEKPKCNPLKETSPSAVWRETSNRNMPQSNSRILPFISENLDGDLAPEDEAVKLDDLMVFVKEEIPSDTEVVDDCILPSCRSPVLLDESYTSWTLSQNQPGGVRGITFADEDASRQSERRNFPNIENSENCPPKSPRAESNKIDRLSTPLDRRSSQKILDDSQKLSPDSRNSSAIHCTTQSPKLVSGRSHSASPNMKLVRDEGSPKRSILAVKNPTQVLADSNRHLENIPIKQSGPCRTISGPKRHYEDSKSESTSSSQRSIDGISVVNGGLRESKSSSQPASQILEVKGPENEKTGEILDMDIGSEFVVGPGVPACESKSTSQPPERSQQLQGENIELVDSEGSKSEQSAEILDMDIGSEFVDDPGVPIRAASPTFEVSLDSKNKGTGHTITFTKYSSCSDDGIAFKSASGNNIKVTQKSLDRMKVLAAEFFGESSTFDQTGQDSTLQKHGVPPETESARTNSSHQNRCSNKMKDQFPSQAIASTPCFGDRQMTEDHQTADSSSRSSPLKLKEGQGGLDRASDFREMNVPVHNNVAVMPIFKSAGGKSIKVSKKSLDKMNALAQEVFGDDAQAIASTTPCFGGTPCKTDGGQPIITSSRSFPLPGSAEDCGGPDPASNLREIQNNVAVMPAFKSAGGKSIKVSKKSLDRMNALAQEVFGDDAPTIASSTPCYGGTPRKTDGGQPIITSSRSQGSAEDCGGPDPALNLREIHNNVAVMPTFKSAGGQSITVSKKSLDRMNALAQEVFGDDSPTIASSTPCFGGTPRKTDGGQPIITSSRSFPLQGSAEDCGGPDPALNLGEIQNNVAVMPAFKSAGGKSIKVSKKSLDRMNALASECFGEALPGIPSTSTARTPNRYRSIPSSSDTSVVPQSAQNSLIAEYPPSCAKEKHVLDQKHRLNSANPRRNIQRSSNPLGSPEWEEFPDLAYSQAAILDEFLDRQKPNSIGEENFIAPPSRESVAKQRNGQSRKNLDNVFAEPNFNNLRKRKPLPASVEGVKKKFKPEISSPQVSELKKRLRLQQKELIDAKDNLTTVPVPGLLSRKKARTGRLTLQDFDEEMKIVSECNANNMIVKTSVAQVSSENATRYRFHSKHQELESGAKIEDGSIVADSCLVVFADDGTAGLPEISTAFFTSPNVSPNLVPENWLANHYRWIVWKLACMERSFPEYLYSRCLTLENTLLQLKYRYDKEIDLTQRSAFRKILEADAPPNRFVCCVASVKKIDGDCAEEKIELELTDGWYSIWATCDEEMMNLVKRDVILVGTKMLVHGAEILNCQQGCNPLQVPSDVRLKISTNSTRRVKWHAKLGFTLQNTPISTLLSTLLPKGGRIGRLTATVVRKYPPIYLCKDGDGKTVSRSERSLAILNEQRQKNKSDEAERVYAKLWKGIQDQYKPAKSKKKVSTAELSTITDPEELYSIADEMDDEYIQSQLTTEQLKIVAKFKENLASRINHEAMEALKRHMDSSEPELKVTKLLKVRLMDFIDEQQALLTIWRPSEEDVSCLCEHKAYDFYNLDAGGTRDKLLQLSNLRQFCHVPNGLIPDVDEKFKRRVTPLSALNSSDFAPTFDELDLVGIVVFVKKPQSQDSGGVTVVYLADPEENCMSITFWTSLSVFGCENIVREGSVICCSNLQWRPVSNQRSKIPIVFAKEFTSFSLNPQQSHLQEALHEIKAKLAEKNVESLLSSVKTSIGQIARINMNSPSPVSNRCRPMLSPAQEKLKLLSRYGGEGPALSPMPLQVATRHVFQEFKSPCGTPSSSNKVRQRARRILDDLPSPSCGEKQNTLG